METLPVALVAFLALYMVPFAFGLQCYACTNHPELSGGTKCDSDKAEKITCDAVLYNRCVTLKYTMSLGLLGSRSIEQRNCSNVLSCDPKYQFNSCNALNFTGMLTDCSVDCCQGDLCNKVEEATTKPKPTSDGLVLAASLGAILSVFILNMFA